MITKTFNQKIELTNDGQLSFFFVGTGTAFSKTNFQTNLLIIKGQDHLVVDCGTLFSYAWENIYNSKITEIKNLLLTHPHADHIGGVEELALVGRYVKKSKLNLIITDEFKKKLWNESLRGGCQFSEDGKMTFDHYFNQIKPAPLCKKPYPLYETNIGSINLKLFRTFHVTTRPDSYKNSQYSVGLIVDDKILFTGDTQFKPEQLKWLSSKYNLQYIFHDCDLSGYSKGVHATYDQLKTLDSETKNKMYLCHYNNDAKKIDCTTDGFAGFAKSGIYYCFD